MVEHSTHDHFPSVQLVLGVLIFVGMTLTLAALAEQAVRLVELQHHGPAVRGVEEAIEILLGLADVLARDGCKIDPIERKRELRGEPARGESLAGT